VEEFLHLFQEVLEGCQVAPEEVLLWELGQEQELGLRLVRQVAELVVAEQLQLEE